MRINQRGSGAIVAASQNQYPVDRWTANTNATNSITVQQIADAPAGFNYSVRATSGPTGAAYSASHYAFFTQKIEGFNIADLAWGTASAKPITLSFWVKTSANAVGTHAVAVENSTGTMNYVATYTVSSTNWEYKVIQIQGPTSGTFNVDTTLGINLNFTLGAGANYDATAGVWTSGKYSVAGAVDLGALSSATWQITGVQLEQNTQPTPFEQRPYGIEDFLCKRYYQVWSNSSNTNFMSIGNALYSTPMSLSVPMRTLTSTSTTYVGSVYAQSTSYTLNSLTVVTHDVSRPQYFTLYGTFSGSWNYSWPICTFNNHTCVFNAEL